MLATCGVRYREAMPLSLALALALTTGVAQEPALDAEEAEDGALVLPREGPLPSEGLAGAPLAGSAARPLDQGYVKVKAPEGRGTVVFIAAAASFGAGALTQLLDLAVNDGAGSGVLERVFIGSAMVLAPIGGHLRGRHDAYMDTALGRRRRATRPWLAAGLALAGVGAAAGIANEVLWWRCWTGETGPYAIPPPSSALFTPVVTCRSTPARLILDGSALMVSSGLAMALWGIRYGRDSRSYERAVLAVVPRVGASELGLGLTGRF